MIGLYGIHCRERQIDRTPLRRGVNAVESRRGASSHQHNPFLALAAPETTETAGECYGATLIYSCLLYTSEKDGSRALLSRALEAGEKLAVQYGEEAAATCCSKKRSALRLQPIEHYGSKQTAALLGLARLLDEKQAAAFVLKDGARRMSTFMSYYLLKIAAAEDMKAALEMLETYYLSLIHIFFSADKAFADDGKGDIYSFQYDCMEFYFSAANRVGAYGEGDVQFIFTCQDDGKRCV